MPDRNALADADYGHGSRTTKHYDQWAGECVCKHCRNLPWHVGERVKGVPAYTPTTPDPVRLHITEP